MELWEKEVIEIYFMVDMFSRGEVKFSPLRCKPAIIKQVQLH